MKTNFKLIMQATLIKALSNFTTVMEFQNKDFNAHKPRQYGNISKEIVKINKRYKEYFVLVSLPLFPSDMDEEGEFLKKLAPARLTPSQLTSSSGWILHIITFQIVPQASWGRASSPHV